MQFGVELKKLQSTRLKYDVLVSLLPRTRCFTILSDFKQFIKKKVDEIKSINQFSGPAYPWGVAGAAAQVGASKHLDPLQQRIDALL